MAVQVLRNLIGEMLHGSASLVSNRIVHTGAEAGLDACTLAFSETGLASICSAILRLADH